MTTQRQIAANRRNTLRSTGPRTAAGKAASSGNARRHGLTAELDEAAILTRYQLLLEDETAVPDPLEQDPYRRSALELARAEAHLQRVRATEEQALHAVEVPSKEEEELESMRDRVLETLLDDVFAGQSRTDVFRLVPNDEAWLLPHHRPPPEDQANLLARLVELEKSLGLFVEHPPVDEAALQAAYDADFEAYVDKLEAFVRSPFVQVGWDKKGFGLMRHYDREIDRIRRERRDAYERVAPAFARYRALAEARRLRALARWTEQVALRQQTPDTAC